MKQGPTLRLLPVRPQRVLLWVEQTGASAEPRQPLWLLFSPDQFLHLLQEASWALRVMDVLSPFLNSLGKSLALSLLVYNDAHGMLGDIADSSGIAMVTLLGHYFLNSAHSLDICSITLLIDLHVHGQRNNSMCPKGPAEHVASALCLSLLVSVILSSYWRLAATAEQSFHFLQSEPFKNLKF